ncbi:MAG: DUF935 family protein [Pseudomonadota bacterium]|nr:DUF935 family protein [Pseudomonadota bacterium]
MYKPKISYKQFKHLRKVIDQAKTDPNFFSSMLELPNVDPILRKAGKSSAIYEEISRDAHVIGELRSLRAGMHAFSAEILPGGDDAASMQSFKLAKSYFASKPDENTEWIDVDWHNYSAILYGFSATHIGAYQKQGNVWLPSYIEPWKHSRFAFNNSNQLLVKTKENPKGEETDIGRWTCVRHMPNTTNKYGIPLLSSCFWPWMFKHGGFKFLVQLTERFGIPFPIGKYPVGTPDKEVENLVNGLAKLIEEGIAVIPDDASVDILESKLSGEPLPLQLINVCNSEISKALTSQTLATEQKQGGARAASETHAKRASENQKADRELVANYRNQILTAIHHVNFNGGEPPKFKFKDKRDVNLETVNRIKETAKFIQVPEDYAYEQLGVPKPRTGERVLEIADEGKGIATPAKIDFSSADNSEHITEFDDFDAAISKQIEQIWEFANSANSLQELQTTIANAFPDLSETALFDVTNKALQLEYIQGMAEADK